MHLSLSILFILYRIAFTRSSSDDHDFFSLDNLDDDLFSDVSDSHSSNTAFDPWGESNGGDIFNQASNGNTNIDMVSQINQDDTNADLFAAGCSTNDRLGARDGGTNCLNSAGQLKVPELPSLDKLEDIAAPPIPQNQGSDDRSVDTSLTITKINGICPILKPIHLCCLCEAQFQFTYCQDCLPMETVVVCYSPHVEVCCQKYGLRVVNPSTGLTNLDNWVRGWYEFDVNLGLDMQEGAIAESCGEVGRLGIP